MGKNFKNPLLRKRSIENHPSGDLLEELKEQDMSDITGGWGTRAQSIAKARSMGLGTNYGKYCTLSAECFSTIPCA
ncbi:plantaricin C family lantibiotic [Bacillus changyiensis]|uniref:plantaricin C family lantibiotic n=1 Tax=Bacillus changyiensis TaxID=3004103 RepID=UPI0022E8AC1C|nr:plantaricin C family lantibiotic [Bacillus changyiensis]MDA1477689.1 plantaricin C family lantibiotic [Bacillus changyiensis]